ncbi:MAG: aldose epimerase family protein [Saprospiraceae bacterium]
MHIREFGIMPDGTKVSEYTLANHHGLEMSVINYGCTITSILVPDRQGQLGDVVLGFDSIDGYLASNHYIGSVIGRYANRIASGKFTLSGQEFSLPVNLAPHHLHGGLNGFNKKLWSARPFENDEGEGVDFVYKSPDGEEGYPGTLDVTVRYLLSHENDIIFHYTAGTDRLTILNLSQHSYFNLNTHGGDILEHQLMLKADQYLPVNDQMIPTGELKDVIGSPFDFRQMKPVGKDMSPKDKQIKIANGYDHNWVLDKKQNELSVAATLFDPESGRKMQVYTTEPGIQLYAGNFLDHQIGKSNNLYGPYAGLCLETQHFPDSPNQPNFPSVNLNPGQTFQSTTILHFSVD